MKYNIKPMTRDNATSISNWKYGNEYSIYSMDGSQELVDELLDGSYYSVKEKGNLIGYFCFGNTAQVPAGNESGAYKDSSFIDIGLGMNPEMCGVGLGLDFALSGIEFAISNFDTNKFRLTVADFNARAIKVYERAGFYTVGSFIRNTDEVRFDVMIRDK